MTALTVQDKVWKVIRGLNEFTFEEVAIVTESPQKAVTLYLLKLYKAGYIRQAGKRISENGRKKIFWRLVKNTGPLAPVAMLCLYDPNTDIIKDSKGIRSWVNPETVKPKRRKRHVA